MSAAQVQAKPEVRTYGGWREPRNMGIGVLTMRETMAALGGLIVVFATMMISNVLWAGGVLVIEAGVLWLVTTKDKHGMSLLDKGAERLRFRRAARGGGTRYVSGPLAPRYTTGGFRLPGVLWRSTLSEHTDSVGRRFALVHHGDKSLAVVMALSPPGTGLVDLDQANDLVALFGHWLGNLSGEAGVAAASVSVETCPDSGERLRRAMARQSAAGAPEVARRVISEVVDSSAQGAVDIKVWASLTFMGAGKQEDLAVQEIATRLPGLTQTLQHAGTGPVHLMTAGELCQMVRIAHDPASAALFDTAASRGETVALEWGQCGPAGHEALSDRYEHDSGVSRVWTMSLPPQGLVQFRVLEPILGLHPNVERKRVTILYRPIDAAMAPSIIDNDVNHANARLTGANPKARDVRAAAVVQQMANEEAAGGGLLDFGAVITCTTTSGDVADAAAPVESLASSSRLLIREAWGAQDSGFAVGLPLGLQPGDQAMKKRGR